MSTPLDSLREHVRYHRAPHHLPQPGVWVVGGGKGGVGTSTMAALIAVAGRAVGRVLLVDGNEVSGSLHILLGVSPQTEGIGLLRHPDVRPEELITPLSKSVDLLPGGGADDASFLASGGGQRHYLFGRIRDLFSRYDLVVIDGGSRLDTVGVACRTGAERLFVVTTPDRVASGVSYALLKASNRRFPGLHMGLLINHASRIVGRRVADVVRGAAERFLELDIEYHGSVPTDGRLDQMIGEGLPWLDRVAAASLPAVTAVAGTVNGLLPRSGGQRDAHIHLSATP